MAHDIDVFEILKAPLRRRGNLARKHDVDACALAVALNDHIRATDPLVQAFVEWRPMPETGRLDKFPITATYKDLIDVAGFATRYGSVCGLRHYPLISAQVAERLSRGGVWCLGKVETSEFGLGVSAHTRNPSFPDYGPNGSSCGSGAAVAAGLCDVSVATDSTASARNPAANCGVVGLRLTRDAGLAAGVFAISPTLDSIGLVTRTCDDLVVVLQQTGIAGGKPGAPEVPSRVRVVENWIDAPHAPVVRTSWDSFLVELERIGIEIVPVRVPLLMEYKMAWPLIVYEAAEVHRSLPWRQVRYSDPVRAVLDEGSVINAEGYAAVRRKRDALKSRIERFFQDDHAPLMLPLNLRPPRKLSEPPYVRVGQPTEGDEPDPGMGSVASLADLPSLAFPLPAQPGDPPLAVQFIGPRRSERMLATLGAQIECPQ